MTQPAVEISSLTHRYGDVTALSEVSFTVGEGQLFGLLGPNGGGKTTLFRILSTLIAPAQGTATIFGHRTTSDARAVRNDLGVIFQHISLDDALTVEENLRVHAALYGLSGVRFRERMDHLLEIFGIADRRHDRVRALSGGLQRRADLARGLLHAPRLLLLDEPTTGLDPVARHAFWHALARLRQQEGTTMMLATHLLDEAERCDVVGILDRGRLVALGTPDALKAEFGEETLWLETSAADRLTAAIHDRFDLDVRAVGPAVQVLHGDPPALIPVLYEAFGDLIVSATIRRPSLEDVFMVHAGHRLGNGTAGLPTNHATPA